MSGARIINDDSFQQLIAIVEFANQMGKFAKDQLDQYAKDPRIDIDSLDRIKLYYATIRVYKHSEINVNQFIKKNVENNNYMEDYEEASSDDDDGYRGFASDYHQQDSDQDDDIRGRCGQRAIKNEIDAFKNMGIDDFDDLPSDDDKKENEHTLDVLHPDNIPVDAENNQDTPEPKRKIDDFDGESKENGSNTSNIEPLKLVIPTKYLPAQQTVISDKYNRKNWKPVQNNQ